MTPPLCNARPLCLRAIAYAAVLCLLLSPLAPAAAAQTKSRTKVPPARVEITQKDPNAVLRPGAGVAFVAKVYSRRGELLEGSEVKWRAAGSSAVTVGQFVNDGATHEATLIGFSPEGRQPASALVSLTASVGSVSSDPIVIPFRANLAIEVEAAPKKLAPGESYLPKATVKDGDTVVKDAHVKWTYATPSDKDFVLLSRDNKDVYSVVALKAPDDKSKPAPSNVIIVANYSGVIAPLSIPYGEGGRTESKEKPVETAEVGEILVSATGIPADPCASPTPKPTPASPFDAEAEYDIEAGRRLALTARLVKANCNDKNPLPKLVWSVPKDMSEHIAILEQNGDGRAVFYGLTPESDSDQVRESLYVLVQAVDKGKDKKAERLEDGDSIKYVKAVPIRNAEQTVDVSWNVLPHDVVAKNYGRGVSDKFFGIEVVVGNNSGNDLQLTGMSFKLDHNWAKGQNGQNGQNGQIVLNGQNGQGNGVQSWVPVASYEVVRAMTEQRKFSFKSRSTILSSLSAAAQIMTGFTPFFNVATRARNFSHGINIINNPVMRGIEGVWPDPLQDERDRLERQALHDDKIVPNGAVYRTTVFFPRDLLGRPNGETLTAGGASKDKATNGGNKGKAGKEGEQVIHEDNLLAIKERLGQLILVGSKLSRNDFRMRVRQQGYRQAVNPNNQ